MPPVYVLEDRANSIYMHWFLFTMAGLRDIPTPAFIHTRVTEDFQRDTLKLLAPDYTYVESTEGYTPIHVHGAPLVGGFHVPDVYYGFVRTLLLSRIPLPLGPPTRILYVSRNRAQEVSWRKITQPTSIRQLLNEEELLNQLTPFGVERVYLEDFSLIEKIQLFQTAKLVIAPSGGALTTCFFANPATRVLEIRSNDWTQYTHICEVLGIRIVTYRDVIQTSDGTDNYSLRDIPTFVNTVTSLLT
jgi:capsular polysaccharide biosynthesis protein